MKRMLILLAVGGALMVGAASPGIAGNGLLRLSWDDCDPLVTNKNYTTASVYTIVLSVSDADVANNGHRTKATFGPNLAEAWKFYAGGCQVGQLLVSFAGVSKACPAYAGTNPLPLSLFRDNGDGTATMDVANTFDDFTPLLGTRYTMWQAAFNHAFSTVGDGDPAVFCTFAGDAMCAVLGNPDGAPNEILLINGDTDIYDFEIGWVTWNNIGGCPAIQTKESSWGRVKGLYR